MKIKAAVTFAKGEVFQITEVELAEPKMTEVLVRMVGVGVCHTDALARDQFMPVPLPAVLGHEGAGIVEKVGAGVTDFAPGDHVVISYYSCGRCEYCLTGHPNLCVDGLKVNNIGGVYADDTRRLSYQDQELSCFFGQSSFATYAVTDQRNCVKVDTDLDLTILGPLGCGIQHGAGAVLNTLQPVPGESIAVFGCGGVGFSAIMAAKVAGCKTIIGVDIIPSRLKQAKELGATHVIDSHDAQQVTAEIKKICPQGVHYVIDTTAIPVLIDQGLQALKPLGTCVMLANTGDKMVPLNLKSGILLGQKRLIGVIEGESIPQVFIPQLLALYQAGNFPFDKLITKYKFTEINQAFADSKNGKAIKPVLYF